MSTDHKPHKIFESLRDSGFSRHESQWLGGVCSGLAEKFQVDTVLVRGVAVALTLLGGIGLIAYGLAWAFMPDTNGQIHFEEALKKNWTVGMSGALTAFLLGVGPAPWIFSSVAPFIWPLLLIAAVLFIIFSRKNTRFSTGPRSSADSASSPTEAGTAAHFTADREDRPATTPMVPFAARPKPPTDSASDDFLSSSVSWDLQDESGTEARTTNKEHIMDPAPEAHPFEPHAPKKTPKIPEAPPVPGWVATIVVGVAALIVAIIFCVDYFGVFTFPAGSWSLALSLGLLFVGLVLVIAALSYRTSGGLLGLAIPLLVLSLIFGNTGFNNTTGFGVQSGDQLQQSSDGEFNAVFSNATVDLRHYAGSNVPVDVELNTVFASVELLLPPDMPVRVESNGIFLSQGGDQPANSTTQGDQNVLTVEVNGIFSRITTTQDQTAIPSNSSDF